MGRFCVPLEHIPCHGHGKFVLAEKYLSGNVVFKRRQLFIAMGTHNHLDGGIHRPRDLDHAAHIDGIRHSDDQDARPVEMRLDQNGRLGSVAEHRRYIALAQLLHDLTIVLHHDIEMAFAVSAVPMRRPILPPGRWPDKPMVQSLQPQSRTRQRGTSMFSPQR